MERLKDRQIAELTHSLNQYDLEEILDKAIEKIPHIIESHRVSIYLLDSEGKNLISRRHSSKRLQEHLSEVIKADSTASLISQVLIKNKPLLIPNVAEYIIKNNLDIKLSKRQRYTSGSCMLSPITLVLPGEREKIIGVINFAEKADFTPFSKTDLELSKHVGEILGTAIHNCAVAEKKLGGRQKELMSELDKAKEAAAEAKKVDLAEAKKKQTQMLPETPQIPDYDLHVYYEPMETVGGDFYDFIPMGENEIGIVVGDVSGHGVEAALVMSMAKQILSIYIKLHRSLTDTLCHANEEICASLKGSAFIAVFIGILNTKTHILRFARAGQAYPLLYQPVHGGGVAPHEIESRGMVLGTARGDMFKNKIEEKKIQLMPDDVLLLYSDGILEAPNPQEEEFSVERVAKCVEDSAAQTAKGINEHMIQKIYDFTQGPQADDITCVCIKAGSNIEVKNNFDGVMIEDDSACSQEDDFMLAPDLSFDEEVQYQMLSYEEEVHKVQADYEEIKEEKKKLEKRCLELQQELDLAANDPDGLIKQLRAQLSIALELPKDLINDNKGLHEQIESQKKELRKLELELNDYATSTEFLEKERNTLREKISQCPRNVAKELLSDKYQLDEVLYNKIKEADYAGVYQYLEEALHLATHKKDIEKVKSLQKQTFSISKLLQSHLLNLVNFVTK